LSKASPLSQTAAAVLLPSCHTCCCITSCVYRSATARQTAAAAFCS
jgi:hypothetical protein